MKGRKKQGTVVQYRRGTCPAASQKIAEGSVFLQLVILIQLIFTQTLCYISYYAPQMEKHIIFAFEIYPHSSQVIWELPACSLQREVLWRGYTGACGEAKAVAVLWSEGDLVRTGEVVAQSVAAFFMSAELAAAAVLAISIISCTWPQESWMKFGIKCHSAET